MMLFAKGIASGFPFAVIAARHDLYDNMTKGMMVRDCVQWMSLTSLVLLPDDYRKSLGGVYTLMIMMAPKYV